jgi:transcriptional regulator with XRE-family HTH domain
MNWLHETAGGRLQTERLRLGLTQPKLAKVGQVTMRSVRKYEKNESAPNTRFFALAAAAGIDVLYVITGRSEAGKRTEKSLEEAAALVSMIEATKLSLDVLIDRLNALLAVPKDKQP